MGQYDDLLDDFFPGDRPAQRGRGEPRKARSSAIQRGQFDDVLDDTPVQLPEIRLAQKEPAPTDLPNRGALQVIGDTAIEAGGALVGTVGAIGNMVAPGNRVSKAADDLVKYGNANQSEQTQATKRQFQQEMDAAQSFGEEAAIAAKYAVNNPLLTAANIAGNLVGPGVAVKGGKLLGGAVARSVARGGADDVARAVARAEGAGATAGGVAFGAAAGGGDAAGQAYELVTDPRRRGVVLASPQAAELRQQNPNATDEQIIESLAVSAARQASIIPAAIGGVSGAFGLERVLAGRARPAATRLGQAVRTGAVEGVQEGAEEAATGISGRYFPSQIDPSIDPLKGAGGDAALGAIYGGGMGVVGGALSRPGGATSVEETPAADPAAQPASQPAAQAPVQDPVQATVQAPVQAGLPADLQNVGTVDEMGNRVAAGQQTDQQTDPLADVSTNAENNAGVAATVADPTGESFSPTEAVPDPKTYDDILPATEADQEVSLDQVADVMGRDLGIPEGDRIDLKLAVADEVGQARFDLSTRMARTIEKLFGVKTLVADFGEDGRMGTVAGQDLGPSVNGAYVGSNRVVLLNARSNDLLKTPIHEIVHALEKEQADLYKPLEEIALKYADQARVAALNAALNTAGESRAAILRSELVAEVMAEQADPKMWDELFERAGESAPSLRGRLVQWLNTLYTALVAEKTFVKEAARVKEIRTQLNDSFTKWQVRTAQSRVDSAGKPATPIPQTAPQAAQEAPQAPAAAQTAQSATQAPQAAVEQPTDPEALYGFVKDAVIAGTTRPSTTGIQQAHRVGYEKALKISRRLEKEGVVSGDKGARTVQAVKPAPVGPDARKAPEKSQQPATPETIPEPTYDEEINEEPTPRYSRQQEARPDADGVQFSRGPDNPDSPLKSYVSQEDGEGRVRRREGRRDGVGAPDNERVEYTIPVQINGSTVDVSVMLGRITPEDWARRTTSVMSLEELADARVWYQSLNDALTPVYGPDATKYALAWLLSQKRASPSKGFTDVLRAADIASGKQRVQIAGLNEQALIDTMQGRVPERDIGPKLLDFVDSELGKTTRTAVRDDARGRMPAAIDVWAFRDIGFIDERTKEFIREKVGEEAANALKIDSFTEASYEYGIDFYNDIADQLNEDGFDGGKWKAAEIQAIGWVAMQKVMGEQAEFVRDIIGKNTRRVSIGLAPGGGSRMEGLLQGKEIDPKVAQSVIRRLAKASGIKILKNEVGAGAYLTYVEGAIQIDALASPESVADFMDMVGYVFQQTEVIATRPMKSGKNSAIDILTPELGTIGDATRFFQAFLEAQPKDKGGDPIAPGFQQITVGDVPGIRLLNFGGKWGKRDMPRLAQAIADAADAVGLNSDAIQVDEFNVQLTSTKNDWTEDHNGQAYLDSLTARGRVREARELERRYAPSRFDLDGDGSILWRRERRVPGGLRSGRDGNEGDGEADVQFSRALQYQGQVTGTAPVFSDRQIQPAAAEFVGYHYSAVPRAQLSGTAYGSATSANRGKEYERVMGSRDRRLRNRVYFYTAPMAEIPRSEPVVTGAQIHKAVLKNIYDVRNEDARLDGKSGGSEFESAVIDAGYDGYVSHEAGMIVLLNTRPVPVQHIGNRQGMREQIMPNPVLTGAVKIKYPNRSVLARDGMLTKRPEGNESLSPQQRAAVKEAAPSFKMEYGEYKVRPEEKDAANAAMSESGSALQFSRQLNRFAEDVSAGRKTEPMALVMGEPTPLMRMVGMGWNKPVIARASEIIHTIRKHPEIEPRLYGELPALLARPRAVIDDTENGSKMFILDRRDSKGNPLVAVLKPDSIETPKGSFKVTLQKTAYGLTDSGAVVARAVANPGANKRIAYVAQKEIARVRELLGGASIAPATQGTPLGVLRERSVSVLSDSALVKYAANPNGDWRTAGVEISISPDWESSSNVLFSRRVWDNPKFQSWFGKSTIVDADGNPKVMYHRTARDISVFRAKQAGAIFVTDSPRFADNFSFSSEQYVEKEGLENPDPEVRFQIIDAVKARIKEEYPKDRASRAALNKQLDGWKEGAPLPDGEVRDYIREAGQQTGMIGGGRNILPLYVKAENPFDYENKAHVDAVVDYVFDKGVAPWSKGDRGGPWDTHLRSALEEGRWTMIEIESIQAAIKALGHDSFYVSEGGQKNLGVYEPTQLKSAIGNNGEYDPKNPDIRFSRPIKYVGSRFNIADRSKRERAANLLTNEMSRAKDVREQVGMQGGALSDDNDTDMQNRLSIRMAGTKVERFRQTVIVPLMKRAEKLGTAAKVGKDVLSDASLLMYASHAPERNAYIAGINPTMPDGGSGMKNQDAANAINLLKSKYGPVNFIRLTALANDMQAITQKTQNVLVSGGLVDPVLAQNWNGRYSSYVPLKGFERIDEENRETSNIDPRWDFSKRALGRQSKAGQIIENILKDHERAILMVAKNDVRRSFLKFVRDNKDDKLWEVNRVVITPQFRKTIGLQSPVGQAQGIVNHVAALNKNQRNTVAVRESGQLYYISVTDKALLNDLNQEMSTGTPEDARAILRAWASINRSLGFVWTALSPVFVLTNYLRDVTAGTIKTARDFGVVRGAKVLGNSVRAIPSIWKAVYTKNWTGGSTQYERWFNEFREQGGAMGIVSQLSVDDQHNRLMDAYKAYEGAIAKDPKTWARPALKYVTGITDFIVNANSGIEQAVRVAAYAEERKAFTAANPNATQQQIASNMKKAADVAASVTVDFARRGKYGPAIGSLYLFYNPAVQGTLNLMNVLKGRSGAAVAGSLIALGFMWAAMASQATGDDDEPYWDQPNQDQTKLKNLVYFAPNGDRYTMPIPYGFGFFVNFGHALHDLTRGKDPWKVSKFVLNSLTQHFSPLGSPDNMATFLSPTILDPVMVALTEQKEDGKPLMPKDFVGGTPDSERYFTGTRGTAVQQATSWVNEATGGNSSRAGLVSVSPETVNYLFSFLTGGAGTTVRDLYQSIDLTMNVDSNAAIDKNKWPVLRSFYRKADNRGYQSSFYENAAEVEAATKEMKEQFLSEDPGTQERIAENYGIASMGRVLDSMKQQLSSLRKQEVAIIDNGDLSRREKEEMRKEIEEQRTLLYVSFNSAFFGVKD